MGNKFSGDFDPERMQDFPSFREELERMRHDAVNKMASSKAEWLDSNLAGLLAAGVPKSDIEMAILYLPNPAANRCIQGGAKW